MSNKFRIRYEVFSALTSFVESSVKRISFNSQYVAKFFEDDLSRRLKQALIFLTISDYINSYLKNGNVHDLQGENYSIIDGKFNFSSIEKFKIVVRFTAGNILVLKSLFLGVFTKSKVSEKNAILHCFGRESLYEGEGRAEANEFLERGPFPFINTSRLFIGVNRPIRSEGFRFNQSMFPVLELLKTTNLTAIERLRLLKHVSYNFLWYLWHAFLNPSLFLLYSDFLWLPVFYALNRKGSLHHYIFDNSDFNKQILPVVSLKGRAFTTEMIFYAGNTKGFKYKNVSEVAEYPHYKFMKVDRAWVWNNESKKWLSDNCPSVKEAHVVGSVMFYMDNQKTKRLPGEYRVLVFDVTPLSDEWRNTYVGGSSIGFDYYSPEHMRKFIEEIEYSLSDLGDKVNVFIKPKRKPSEKWHDKKYVEMLKSNERIQILDPDTNIYELIRGVDVVLAIPFTSPLHIAEELGARSIYFDPTGALDFSDVESNGMVFIQSKEELKKKIEYYYSEKLS